MGELPLDDDAFTAQLPGNIGDLEQAKVRALGLEMNAHTALTDRFTADFSVDAGGFPQFADIADGLTQAVATGRVRAACESAGRNLIELRLHEHGVHHVVGPNGMAWPGHDKSVAADITRDFLGLHIAGAFRAAASVLDCWSAVLIGVTRLPTSLAKASAGDITSISERGPRLTRALPDAPPAQVALWERLATDYRAAAESAGPTGWLEWTTHMRNALVHRGRGLSMFTNRPTAGLIVPDHYRERPHEFVRYDPVLARRPWVQHIQDVVEQGPLGPYLAEPAQITLTALRESLNAFSEALATWSLATWADPVQDELVSPASKWTETTDEPGFAGFTDAGTTNADIGITGPESQEVFRLAQRLIEQRES